MRHVWYPKHREPVICRCGDTHDADCEAQPLIGQTDWGLVAITLWIIFMGVVLLHG